MRQDIKVKINAGIVHEGDTITMKLADGTTQKARASRTRVWPCPPLTYHVTVNGKIVVDLDPLEVIDESELPKESLYHGAAMRMYAPGKKNRK